MPLYEYKCPKCDKVVIDVSSEPKKTKKCPECGARAEKMISVPVIQMRGYSPCHPRFMRGQRDR